MGLLLFIIFVVSLILAVKYKKAKIKWLFIIATPIVLAVIVWYFLPFHFELIEHLDASTSSIRVDSGHSRYEVEIIDDSVKSEILGILSNAEYQRKEFLGTFFAGPHTDSKTYISIYIRDLNTGELYQYWLIDERPFHSSVVITYKNRCYKIQNSSDLIADLNVLLEK